jgi:hypothetical protein
LARGRQFKSYYEQAQKLSLEGSFDDYFDTYAPEHYTIDTMSFVSPEVMQAIMDLKDYDVEVLNNRVLVYAPLLSELELSEFYARCQTLAKELNDNLARYRDSYLPSRSARKNIMPFARLLLENPWKANWIGVFVSAGLVTFWFVAGIDTDVEFVLAILCSIILMFYLARVAMVYQRNRRAKAAFYSDLRVIQERGRY